MDAVEILLSCVVGFSVLAFLIIAHLEETHRKKSVGADEGTEERTVISEGFSKRAEIAEEEERENPAAMVSDVRENKGENDGDEFIDDWEGVERTELEKAFGEAVVFVNNGDGVCEDVKVELYGLSKIALEGPCYESQPLALKVAARSKWNAWQKLGNMSRETAMEKYIDVLSNAVPSWKANGEGTVTVKDGAISEDLTSTMPRDSHRVES